MSRKYNLPPPAWSEMAELVRRYGKPSEYDPDYRQQVKIAVGSISPGNKFVEDLEPEEVREIYRKKIYGEGEGFTGLDDETLEEFGVDESDFSPVRKKLLAVAERYVEDLPNPPGEST